MSAAHIKTSPCSCVCAVWTHMTEWPRFTRLHVLKVTSLSTLLCFGLICTSHFPKAGSRDYIFIAFPVLASFIRIPSVKWWHLFIYLFIFVWALSPVLLEWRVCLKLKGFHEAVQRPVRVCSWKIRKHYQCIKNQRKALECQWFNLH